MYGSVGDDAAGQELRRFLSDNNVDVDGVDIDATAPTGTAIIVVAGGDNTIVVVAGANEWPEPKDLSLLEAGDAVVAQFETPHEHTVSGFTHAREVGALTFLNPAPARAVSADLLDLVDYLVVNETELRSLSSVDFTADDDGSVEQAVRSLLGQGIKVVVVTLGSSGLLAVQGDSSSGDVIRLDGHDVQAVDSTGAGDCFVGVLAASVANGQPLSDALRIANAAAALSVTKAGAGPSMPHPTEVEEFLA